MHAFGGLIARPAGRGAGGPYAVRRCVSEASVAHLETPGEQLPPRSAAERPRPMRDALAWRSRHAAQPTVSAAFGCWPTEQPDGQLGCCRLCGRRCRHAMLAFLAGLLTGFVCLSASMRAGRLTPGLAGDFGQESPWPGQLQEAPAQRPQPAEPCHPVRPLGLSPLALESLTGSALPAPDRLIVAARHDDDTSWLDVYLSDIPHVVYQVDDPEHTAGAQHATRANKGNEAMAYLQFVLDYYNRLPASMVFLHGHRGTWHLRDHVPVLRRLRWGELGFANLRYGPGSRLDWECGNRTRMEEFRKFDCEWQGSRLRPRGMRPRRESELNVGNKDCWWDSVELREVWPDVFQAELGEVPEAVAAPCCAEFLVSRERILAHPRAFYAHLRDWVLATELGRYRSGRIFEYMWHIIFGEPPVIQAVPECRLLRCDGGSAAALPAAV